MKNIYLLGATGSIGTQTLDVIRQHPDKFRLAACSAGRNLALARHIVAEFRPGFISMQNPEDAQALKAQFPWLQIGHGPEGLTQTATYEGPSDGEDFVVSAVMGSVGLIPTLKAIELKRNIGIANKETLVTAGHLVMDAARRSGIKLLPVDSEHSAIFQCLNGEDLDAVKKLVITASGGSFRDLSRAELKGVTRAQALNHPNWSMGAKITIDSATMMNKGLEVIEAHHLFGMPYEKIETLLHRQSVIHSMVEFADNSLIAHLGTPDMRIPIQYAMSYPERLDLPASPALDLAKLGSLEFREMDFQRFPCLSMAYEAGKKGGSYPTILNAANEAAVELFLQDRISFLGIEDVVYGALEAHEGIQAPTLSQILELDRETRTRILK